jgi:hypothetical protein
MEPTNQCLTEMQNIMDSFVLQNLNVSMERRYLAPQLGGNTPLTIFLERPTLYLG